MNEQDSSKSDLKSINDQELVENKIFDKNLEKNPMNEPEQLDKENSRNNSSEKKLDQKDNSDNITELIFEGKTYGILKVNQIYKPVELKVNGQYVKIENFRSVLFPLSIIPGKEFKLDLAVSFPNGKKIDNNDPAYLSISYNVEGKLDKITLPSSPLPSKDPNEAVLINYKDRIYTLPVNSGHYAELVKKVQENDGEIKFVYQNVPIIVENWIKPNFIPAQPQIGNQFVSPYQHQLPKNNINNPIMNQNINVNNREGNEKMIEIKANNKIYGIVKEIKIAGPFELKVNGQYLQIKEFRAVFFPLNILPGFDFKTDLAITSPNGERINEIDPAYFTINYNMEGKVIKISLPNSPMISMNPMEPILVTYKNSIYTLPVSSGHYNELAAKVKENNGNVDYLFNEPPIIVEKWVNYIGGANHPNENNLGQKPKKKNDIGVYNTDNCCNLI